MRNALICVIFHAICLALYFAGFSFSGFINDLHASLTPLTFFSLFSLVAAISIVICVWYYSDRPKTAKGYLIIPIVWAIAFIPTYFIYPHLDNLIALLEKVAYAPQPFGFELLCVSISIAFIGLNVFIKNYMKDKDGNDVAHEYDSWLLSFFRKIPLSIATICYVIYIQYKMSDLFDLSDAYPIFFTQISMWIMFSLYASTLIYINRIPKTIQSMFGHLALFSGCFLITLLMRYNLDSNLITQLLADPRFKIMMMISGEFIIIGTLFAIYRDRNKARI